MNDSVLIFYVIGDPIDHSLSPVMHNFFLEKFQINGEYRAKPVKLTDLDDAIKSFIKEGVTGINVTTPHKKNVLKFVDKFTPEAETIGSVNTIKFENNKIIGHNTDAIGFQASLRILNYSFKDKNAIIFGAGGAARAVVAALIREQCRRIILTNRSFEKARQLVEQSLRQSLKIETRAIPIDSEEIYELIASSQLLVNTTTVGMGNLIDKSILPDRIYLHHDLLVYDLIYRPYQTKLIQQAESANVTWVNGLDMLILQGIESLKFWIGKNLTLDDQGYAVLKEKLRREVCQE